ncbi:MAG: Tat pathway signal protein [Sphingomonas sp. 32-66-10]|nr:MAG: Tat pathway signal protein [Sphingomonas sp. 32-66-10]
MRRRSFVQSVGAAALASAVPAAARGRGLAGSGDATLRSLLDRIFNDRMTQSPESATALGLDNGKNAALKSQLSGRSAADAARDLARAKRELAAIKAIDPATLAENARLDYDIVTYQLERSISGRERFSYGAAGGRYAPYRLTQLTGAYQDVPDFLDNQHRVRDVADADAYLARLEAFAKVLDQDSERQRADAARGVFAPDYILDTTLKQLAALRDQAPGATGLVTSFRAKLAAANLPPERAVQAEKIVADRIFPALDGQRALVSDLRSRATHDAGVWRLPDGEAYYAAAAEAATTTQLSGDEIHRIGLEQVAEISGRIDTILKAQGMGQGSVGARLVALNERPDQLFPNTDAGRAALLQSLRAQVKAMEQRLPEQFAAVPKAPVEVRRVPPAIQAGAPGGYYQAASLDGARPGIYYINLRDTFDRPKFGLATLSYHEAVPGHHLQVMLALESQDIPLIRRRGGFSGYSEGWALYTEQLADEMGMYDGDPLGQVGYLQSLLFRATRLVVDSGLHAKRWSREQATDYFIATTGIARGRSQGEIDRYTVWPGQACSYKIGHSVWVELRDEAKAKAGDKWDPRQFHDVLRRGAMPLDVLKRVVRARFS